MPESARLSTNGRSALAPTNQSSPGAGEVALVRDLAERGVQAEAAHARAVLRQRLEDDGSVEAGDQSEMRTEVT